VALDQHDQGIEHPGRERHGVAGAMQQLMSQLGAVMGSVLLTTIAVGGTAKNMTPFHTAFLVAAGVSGLGAAAASFARRTRHVATP